MPMRNMRRHIDHVRACGCEEVVPVTSEDEVFLRETFDTSEVVPVEPDPQAYQNQFLMPQQNPL